MHIFNEVFNNLNLSGGTMHNEPDYHKLANMVKSTPNTVHTVKGLKREVDATRVHDIDDNELKQVTKPVQEEKTPPLRLAIAFGALADVTFNVKPCIQKMSVSDIALYLKARVLYQVNACEIVAQILYGALNDSFGGSTSNIFKNKPHVISLCGPSGVGKTQLVNEIRGLLYMGNQEKDYNGLAFIDYRLGQMDREQQMKSLLGPMNEFETCAELESLYAKLIRTSTHYDKALLKRLEGERHFVLVFFDELDKTDKSILDILNGFLDTGELMDRNGRKYVIPDNVRLIVIFTANFGAKAIVSNYDKSKSPALARSWINNELVERGYDEWHISRMGTIIPFNLPSKEELAVILTTKLYSFFDIFNRFACIYGRPDLEYQPALDIVDSFLEIYDPRHGIRDACLRLEEELKKLTSRSVTHFSKWCKKGTPLPFSEVAKVKFGVVSYTPSITVKEICDKTLDLNGIEEDLCCKELIQESLDLKLSVRYISLYHPSVEKPSISIFTPVVKKEYVDHSPILKLIKEYASLQSNSMWSRDIMKILNNEVDSILSTELATSFSNETMKCKQDDSSSLHYGDDDNEEEEEEAVVLTVKNTTKRKREEGKPRICNVCNTEKDFEEFKRYDGKTCLHCKSCRKRLDKERKIMKRGVNKK